MSTAIMAIVVLTLLFGLHRDKVKQVGDAAATVLAGLFEIGICVIFVGAFVMLVKFFWNLV